MKRQHLAPAAAAALAGVLALGGCGASGHTASTPTPPQATYPAHSTATAATSLASPALALTTLSTRMPVPLARLVATASGDRILVLGGLDAADHSTDAVLAFDPALGTIEPAGRLAAGAHDAAVAVLDGRALLVGGGNSRELDDVQSLPLDTAPGTTATVVGHIPQGRSDDSVAVASGELFVVGGYDGHSELPDVLATTDGTSFRVVAKLAVTVRYAAVAAVGDTLWVFGGLHNHVPIDIVQRIDLTTGVATIAGHLPHPLAYAGIAQLDGHLLLIGGVTGTTRQSTIYAVDLAAVTATPAATLPLPTANMAVATMGGAAYIFGGDTTVGGREVKSDAVMRLRFQTS